MFGIVTSGGTFLDGTGSPAFTGDVAIEGDRIVAVDGKAGPGRRVVDADRHGKTAAPARAGSCAPEDRTP